MAFLYELLILPLFNAIFLAVLLVIVLFLKSQKRAAYAVLMRNFLGYFSNPTGYVFLCIFVLLTSMAAFWPNEFFSANLGSLDQLNNWFVYIMMFFIPAITMSIWAEERRQGTDELLLTLPADDFDIVIGKYLAAVAIYTVSLLFSQVSTFSVLSLLTMGELDTGLFFTNYLGFWFIGLAMIALGMVASFLTNNLTVSFILGALFNAPLAFASKADVIAPSREMSRIIKSFSLAEQFDSFGRGVLSLASISFFALVATFGVYLCMVLVGRRHWSGGKNGVEMFLHYLVRVVLLLLIVFAATILFRNNDWMRADASEGQVSSLSPTTVAMLKNLKPQYPVVVEAFISSEVPEKYAKTKTNLISVLREFETVAKRNKVPINVRLNDSIELNSDMEDLAREQYGLIPQTVRVSERGAIVDQPVIMGAAFKSGLDKVVVPFFEPGVPVEYELIRSLNTVARPARKKLGVLRTAAQLTDTLSGNQTGASEPALIAELKKQYDVSVVDPSKPIDISLYTVMLAMQPSSLTPEEMPNFVEAVRAGLPTAIFEDPVVVASQYPGTGEPKVDNGPMSMFMRQPPQPKGDIRPLWKLLEIDIPGEPSQTGGINPDVCWQLYNPYPALASMKEVNKQWIFCSNAAPGAEEGISNNSEITRDLHQILMINAGTLSQSKGSDKKFIPLLETGTSAGTTSYSNLRRSMEGDATRRMVEKPSGIQILAAYIEGPSPVNQANKADENKDAAQKTSSVNPFKVVYVADTDCAAEFFFAIRNQPDMFGFVDFRLQNVSFVLNAIDVLAGEEDYPKIRRHVPEYRTLKQVEAKAGEFLSRAGEKRNEYQTQFALEEQAARDASEQSIVELKDKVEKLQRERGMDPTKRTEIVAAVQQFQARQQLQNHQLEIKTKQLQRDRDKNIQQAQSMADKAILKIQNEYKMWAVFLPPIPPLLVGISVFVARRLREREGISKSRLR